MRVYLLAMSVMVLSVQYASAQGGRLWAIKEDGVWARWAAENNRWDNYNEKRLKIVGTLQIPGGCYFVNPDNSVHYRNVDKDANKSFPGIKAKDLTVGGGGTLWAVTTDGTWSRYSLQEKRWDNYDEKRLKVVGDPTNKQSCYFVDADGNVGWRNVDKDMNKTYPGIKAKDLSVGGGTLWAIQSNGEWARYSNKEKRWDKYAEKRLRVVADPTTPEACYFINPDGSVGWRNVDTKTDKKFPGIKAKEIGVGKS